MIYSTCQLLNYNFLFDPHMGYTSQAELSSAGPLQISRYLDDVVVAWQVLIVSNLKSRKLLD